MSMKHRIATAIGVGAIAAVALAAPAAAHEVRQVGSYQFTVGWQHEPTYAGTLNAVQFFLHDAKGNPIDDIGTPPTLQVTVSTNGQTSDPLDISPSWDPDTGLGTHGEFDAAIIPTVPGTYTFHFTGTLGTQKIDQKFTSSDSTFDNVQEPTSVEFPAKPPSLQTLSVSVSRLDPRVTAASAAAAAAHTTASSAHDKASTAATLGIIGLIAAVVLGGLGFVFGLIAMRRRPS